LVLASCASRITRCGIWDSKVHLCDAGIPIKLPQQETGENGNQA
jgi:hypothetical protein